MVKKTALVCTVFLLVGVFCFPIDIQNEIIEKGTRLVGSPYRYGGTTPSGFDCSGLVNYLYKPHIPSLPRTASAMSGFGSTIPLYEIT
ncbi:MAG: C40 family peptidase, partial [Spirochaetaceae bacterium]|nr:C40 family peptidase [Spirochaetaceae bacterium]